MRVCTAIITAAIGAGGTRQFPLKQVQAYTTNQAIDNDADAFSLDIGDPDNKLGMLLDRDVEVRAKSSWATRRTRAFKSSPGLLATVNASATPTSTMHARTLPPT